MLFAIAQLAGGKWLKRAHAAALQLEKDRDEPDEAMRLFQGLKDTWASSAATRTSEDVCTTLHGHPSGEFADFRGRGPITTQQLAVVLRPYKIMPIHNLVQVQSGTGRNRSMSNQAGYRRSQFENAWVRLLQKPS